MPNQSVGQDLLQYYLNKNLTIPFIILTAFGTVDTAVEAMRLGAYDFLTKLIHLDKLLLIVERALETQKLKVENHRLKKEIDQKSQFQSILGNSPKIQQMRQLIQQVAPSDTSILITGENGTGKEKVANAIHQLSQRYQNPLIKVHCSALSEHLLESELFGHEKGAFTVASHQRLGRFELADGETLFLDEIGDISSLVQVKLLRVLQEREFERVG